MNLREVEDLLAQRGILVYYETYALGAESYVPGYARNLKRRQGRLGNSWYLDEVFIRINGQQHYLWRAVDQDGDVMDILVD
jgi:putative transposase